MRIIWKLLTLRQNITMTQSMTGYHKLSFDYAEKTIHIEIKSLNSKHLDIGSRIPAIYKEKELAIRELIHKHLVRGKIEFNIYVDMCGSTQASSINQDVFISYYEQLKEIAAKTDLTLNHEAISAITRFPDILKQTRQEIEDDEWNTILDKTKTALEMVVSYRKDEGVSMEKDIRESVLRIESLISEVEPFEKARIEEVKNRLKTNLEKLSDIPEMDENRFEQELIYYLEKLDINEEKVRLRNHCNYFLETLKISGPVGKKLGFIAQEMGREINTMGAKANQQAIQKIVVDMKDELEKIKEQLLNIL